jgi:molecular chaperone GrpE
MEDQNDERGQQNGEAVHDELALALKAAEDNLAGWKRAAADFDNYRRREEEKSKELVDFAREVAVAKLLPSLDSLTMALRHTPKMGEPDFEKQYQNWVSGLNGLIQQLEKALGELGVKKIEALGKKFDPNYHEAVRETPGDEDGVVVEELQHGFELNGKVIRPSQVVISKK